MVLSVATARALAAVGVMWDPRPGDRFAIASPQLDGERFWISDLTIEVHHYQDETVLGFNGTTEWALDSVALDKALWLPREDQLRELIGDRLESLRHTSTGWEVHFRPQAEAGSCVVAHADTEEAYAAALLAIAAAARD